MKDDWVLDGLTGILALLLFNNSKYRSNKRIRLGWVIGDQLNRPLLNREPFLTSNGVGLVRFRWLAKYVNTRPEYHLEHKLYRPWGEYEGLLFLKSMGDKSMRLLEKSHRRGNPVIFDANVNYYVIDGKEYYEHMLPSQKQRAEAAEMTKAADAVIADSENIKLECLRYNNNVEWVPDNVRMDLVPRYHPWRFEEKRLKLLWCGEAVKLFELLAINDILQSYSDKIELVIVTNSLDALNRWQADNKQRLERLLKKVSHTIIPYESPKRLFEIYNQGGIFISPRFLDNAYNLGHTEWKITLAMACGRMALCSPLPSYITVANRSNGKGIRVCRSDNEWKEALDSIISNEIDVESEGYSARGVVQRYYSTEVVAAMHSEFIKRAIDSGVQH